MLTAWRATEIYSKSGPKRWKVLALEALSDGSGEAVIAASQGNQRADGKRSQGVIQRQGGTEKVALGALNDAAKIFLIPL